MHTYFTEREKSLGYLTTTISRLLGNRIGKKFAAEGITLTIEQWTLLVMLWHHDGLTQQELAVGLILEKSSVSRALNSLEREGWIIRERQNEDARQKRISLTDKAWAACDTSVHIVRSVLARAQECLSIEEQTTLQTLLQRVLGTLHQE